MNLKQLEHLLAVADTGSFSRAAERLHITQSALSRSVQMLENDLDIRLIDRVGKRNYLTSIGEVLAARARRLLSEASDLRRNLSALKAGNSGPIRVGLGSGPGAVLMTPFLLHMASNHPDEHVTITRGAIEMQIVQLRQRLLDALVIDAGSLPFAPDLVVELLAEMPAGFVCRKGHPLQRRKSVSFDDLVRFPIGSVPLSDATAGILVKHFGPRGHPDELVRLRCEEIDSLLETVAHSDTIFLGTHAAAHDRIVSGELKVLQTNPPFLASGHYVMVTLAGRAETASMKLFRDFTVARLRHVLKK